jgi:hypothetical protein
MTLMETLTCGELDALMRKHRLMVEYGGPDGGAYAFCAVACALDSTWDDIAEHSAPSLLEAVLGVVAKLEGRS